MSKLSDDEEDMTDEQLAEAKKARAEKSNRAQLAELLERMTVKELEDNLEQLVAEPKM